MRILVMVLLGILTNLCFAIAPQLDKIKLPPGFHISIYADNLPAARQLALGNDGTVFVGTRRDKVYALVDSNHDGHADKQYIIADNLYYPNGVAYKDGALYVAEISRVLRYDAILQRLSSPPKPVVVNDSLPDKTHHGYRFIKFAPDGWLYIGIGAPCNVCLSTDPRFATIMRMKADGSDTEIYAKGVRNTVGFDWQPDTDVLWFTDNGRDWLGDDLPPDELNRADNKGGHFGFPYVYGDNIADPKYGNKPYPQQFTPPVQLLGPHVAALGMSFYTGKMFPEAYQGQIFIAEHGSWNRSKKIGYRLTLVKVDGDKAQSYQPFATGWLQGQSPWGRPVATLVMPDGALLVSDDFGGRVYRISYHQ